MIITNEMRRTWGLKQKVPADLTVVADSPGILDGYMPDVSGARTDGLGALEGVRQLLHQGR